MQQLKEKLPKEVFAQLRVLDTQDLNSTLLQKSITFTSFDYFCITINSEGVIRTDSPGTYVDVTNFNIDQVCEKIIRSSVFGYINM